MIPLPHRASSRFKCFQPRSSQRWFEMLLRRAKRHIKRRIDLVLRRDAKSVDKQMRRKDSMLTMQKVFADLVWEICAQAGLRDVGLKGTGSRYQFEIKIFRRKDPVTKHLYPAVSLRPRSPSQYWQDGLIEREI